MNNLQKYTPQILAIVSVITTISVFLICKPIAQDSDYHHFAHELSILNIENFANVVSNLGFVLIGIWGIFKLIQSKNLTLISYSVAIGILLTGFGSAFYHLNPTNETLVWDRIPMTIIFTSFFASIYSYYISKKWATIIWMYALSIGILSVLYWSYTENLGRGDLRLYAIVQFLPIILIFIILSLYYQQNKNIFKPIVSILIWYVVAKVFEHFDHQVFEFTNLISGHPIKHIAASISTFYIIKLILYKYENVSKNH